MKTPARAFIPLACVLIVLGHVIFFALWSSTHEPGRKPSVASTTSGGRKIKKLNQPSLAKLPDLDSRPVPTVADSLPPGRAEALERLRKEVPGVVAEFDPRTQSPSYVQATGRVLTPAKPDAKPRTVVEEFVDHHAALFGHDSAALKQSRLTRDDVTKHSGLATLVMNQQIGGIPVFKTILKANVSKNGELLSISDHFVASPVPNVAVPAISAPRAVSLAAASLDAQVPESSISAVEQPRDAELWQRFSAPGLSDTSAQLTFFPVNASDVRLGWDVTTFSLANNEMFRFVVDAVSGEVLNRTSLTNDSVSANYRVYVDPATMKPLDSPTPMSPGLSSPATTQPAEATRSYFSLDALDSIASPSGWVDETSSETRGNNVDAHTDTDGNNIADLPRPNGGTTFDFDFPLDLAQAPSSSRNAAVTQLFYVTNWMHDRLYQLGFTESAGNFQTDNFGRGGLGNDALQADGQDSSGSNNANMSTPADGAAGRMQMFLFTGPNPDRDGSLDSEVVVHEYTHGLSNRLVGGGVGISATQTIGLGEGWSDFYSLALLSDPADDPNGAYAAGAYAASLLTPSLNSNYYFGIRRYPYSTDLAKNPLTFRDISTSQASAHAGVLLSPLFSSSNQSPSEVHAVGEVWCSMLWEVRANLIAKHGAAGNERMLQLVTDGMKLCPVNPTFVQARDAILQADLINGSADSADIWAGFAKRGLGYGAVAPSSTATSSVVEIFDLPDGFEVTPKSVFSPSLTRLTGPISNGVMTCTLTNLTTASVTWTASASQPWITFSSTSGTLAVGATTIVTATVNNTALSLSTGKQTAMITFAKNGGSVTRGREVSLTVSAPLARAMFVPLDVDPLWSRTGEWGFGTPSGAPVQAGSPDPTSGFTGSNVFGIALAGGYSTTAGGYQYLTSSAINTTGMTGVKLRFKRWLATQGSGYSSATLDVSEDGLNWTSIYTDYSDGHMDTAWGTREYSLGSVAENKPALYLRWGHKAGNYGPRLSYCGWNIDDIELLSATNTPTLSATPLTLSAAMNTPVNVTLGGSDTALPAAPLSCAIVANPSNGTVSGVAPNLIYTPNTDFTGTDTFSFAVTNTNGTSAPALVAVTMVPVSPDISLEQPEGTVLASAGGTVNFGDVLVGSSLSRTFAIKNTAGGPLMIGAPWVDGKDAADFTIVSPGTSRLLPGEKALFRVSFLPSIANAKNAVLHIPSNDPDEAPFDITLTGNGTLIGDGVNLVRDINSTGGGGNPGLFSSSGGVEGPLTVMNGIAFYPATVDGVVSLWRSDGTAAGTYALKTIASSTTTSVSAAFASFGGYVYFAASNGANGTELWRTDGTVVGTVQFKDINSGSGSSNPGNFCAVGPTLYFSATDAASGTELWKTDGTSNGTVLVKDISTGTTNTTFDLMTNVNGTLFFKANDNVSGLELWKSDGTAGGTVLVKDISSGSSSSNPSSFVVLNGMLYFGAGDIDHGFELWRSDGTTAGTVMVKDIWPGASSGSVISLTVFNGKLFFLANDGTLNGELWCSDGTEAGTFMVKDIYPGTNNSVPQYLTVVGSTLFFAANTAGYGTELWKSDGTANGTVMVKDIAAGSTPSLPRWLRAIGGTLYFAAATDGGTDFEMWKSDGSAGGTVRVKDISPGVSGSSPAYFTDLGGIVLFSTDDGVNGRELWRSDGTEAGTYAVLDAQSGTGSSNVGNLRNFNGTLVYSANDGVNGTELWKSGGTPATTVMVKDFGSSSFVSSSPLGLSPFNLTPAGNWLFFAGMDTTTSGIELWKSDGSSMGTVLVKDIQQGAGAGSPSVVTAVGSRVFFSATGSVAQGAELWVSDGTSLGTVLVKDINPVANTGSSISSGVNFNGTFYFVANDGTNGSELWKSDGTTVGTTMVLDILTGSGSSSPANLTIAGGALYFSASNTTSASELWKSDGTAGGTVMVKDINAGVFASSPANFTAMGGLVYFTANTSTSGTELWQTDGTAGGTVMVKDINAGSASSAPSNLVVIGSTLYFSATDAVGGRELWKSDGTANGTMQVADIWPGTSGSSPSQLVNVNGTLCFIATTSAAGQEVWKSDGTAGGTMMIKDLWPGAASSTPTSLTVVGSRLYFTALTPSLSGRELFSFDTGPAVEIAVEQPAGSGLTSGSSNVAFGNADVLGAAVAKTFVIKNAGGQVLQISDVTIDGSDATSFALSSSLNEATLSGGASVSLNVVFAPASSGAKSATLRIASTDSDENPFTIGLSGQGVTAPEIAVEQPDGSTLTDGISTVAVGHSQIGVPLVQTLTVRNAGSAPLHLGSVTLDGTDSSDFMAGAPSASTVPPGGVATIDLVLTPTQLGARRASLHIESDDADEAVFDLSLSGIGSAIEGPLELIDINRLGASPSIANVVNMGGVVYFSATTSDYGTELWKTDGTAAGTVIVKDIATGPSSSSPANFRIIGNTLYFTATNITNGVELWKTDGTATGTVLVKDIASGTSSSSPTQLTVVNGTLYFAATDPATGQELWKSDGTSTGTVLVKDIVSGTFGSGISNLTAFGSLAVFTANDGVNGTELWKSDGTAVGTAMVKDINPNANTGASISGITVFNGAVYFSATDGTNGSELWKSDGTNAGTAMLLDAEAGSGSNNPGGFIASGAWLFYRATTTATGHELWRTDGTAGGTSLVKDIYPGSVTSMANPMTAVANGAGGIYFLADDGAHGIEVWKSDGTYDGTQMVADVWPGNPSSLTVTAPSALTMINGTLYFSATSNGSGAELWRTDGTAAGTRKLTEINPGANSASPSQITTLGSGFVFVASNGADGTELWFSDGSSAGSRLITDLVPGTASSSPALLRAMGGSILFSASDGVGGTELWSSNGITTSLVKDINPGASSGAIGSPFVLETQVSDVTPPVRKYFFAANNGSAGSELWVSDGTADGTVMVKDINSGGNSSSPARLTAMGGRVYFTATDGSAGTELWVSDGTSAGTFMLADINAGSLSSSPVNLTAVGNLLFFMATTAASGTELWVTDGTPSGTVMVKDITSGVASTTFSSSAFVGAGGKFFFVASDSISGSELWVSDGTSAGTVLVKDIFGGTGSSGISSIVAMNGVVYFGANNSTNGTELWKSDGTAVGTVLVKDIAAGTPSSSPGNLTAAGNVLFFTASDGVNGTELWKSDGTSAGTVMVKDIWPGSSSSLASSLTNVGGTLYFSAAASSAQGVELWKSDGTSAGTVLVADLRTVSNQSSSPANITFAGGRIFFTATGPDTGAELWSLDISPRITVEQPVTVDLKDGESVVNFGELTSGTSSRTFTVRNTGVAPLTIQATNVEGPDKGEFSVASLPPVVPVGASTSFTVTFAPATPGDSLGALRIFTDDPEKTPFDITLTGKRLTLAEAWRQSHFGSSENSGEAADDADPDHDGLSNLMEFALNANPQTAGAGELPVITTSTRPSDGKRCITVSYRRRIGGDSLSYALESTTDLVAWATIDLGDLEQAGAPVPTGDGVTETITFRVLPSMDDSPILRFVRLKVMTP